MSLGEWNYQQKSNPLQSRLIWEIRWCKRISALNLGSWVTENKERLKKIAIWRLWYISSEKRMAVSLKNQHWYSGFRFDLKIELRLQWEGKKEDAIMSHSRMALVINAIDWCVHLVLETMQRVWTSFYFLLLSQVKHFDRLRYPYLWEINLAENNSNLKT